MAVASAETEVLITRLIAEASDVDLMRYLGQTGGSALLRDLLECVRDARFLSADDLRHNIAILRQKKVEAASNPAGMIAKGLMPTAGSDEGLPAIRH
jgi:hypothetical protein